VNTEYWIVILKFKIDCVQKIQLFKKNK